MTNKRLQTTYHAELQSTAGLCELKVSDGLATVDALRVQSLQGIELNEFLLYHGAAHDKIDMLQKQGLDPRRGGTNRGKMFGVGTYLASNSSKSDIYADPSSDGERCILMVRACLGEPYRVKKHDQSMRNWSMPPKRPDGKGSLSSVVALTLAEGGAVHNREYVVYKDTHSLPEYTIHYRHARGCECVGCGLIELSVDISSVDISTAQRLQVRAHSLDTIEAVGAALPLDGNGASYKVCYVKRGVSVPLDRSSTLGLLGIVNGSHLLVERID